MTNALCLVCGQTARVDRDHRTFGVTLVDCGRCGRFSFDDDFSDEWGDVEGQRSWWYRLSAWLRERSQPRSTRTMLTGDVADLEATLPVKKFTEQLDLLLRVIEGETKSLGQVALLNAERLAPLVWARDRGEVLALIQHLRDLERLDAKTGGQASPEAVKLSTKGLLRLEELAESAVLNDQVFVAMWFPPAGVPEHDQMQAAYESGIRKAIAAAGYRPFRVDRAPLTADRIDARIMVDIRRSRAVVADATGHRPSVLYEAGFAEGLGKPVIWTVHEDHLNGLPFDTRQFPHLPWKSPEELAKQLVPRIEERLGIRRR